MSADLSVRLTSQNASSFHRSALIVLPPVLWQNDEGRTMKKNNDGLSQSDPDVESEEKSLKKD